MSSENMRDVEYFLGEIKFGDEVISIYEKPYGEGEIEAVDEAGNQRPEVIEEVQKLQAKMTLRNMLVSWIMSVDPETYTPEE